MFSFDYAKGKVGQSTCLNMGWNVKNFVVDIEWVKFEEVIFSINTHKTVLDTYQHQSKCVVVVARHEKNFSIKN
jgi:hypothetical protein